MTTPRFRAWDKEDEVMIDWFWLSSEGDLYETPVTVYDTPHLELERNDDLIAMQYTGLKDENGTEIYEGDIVRVTDDDGSTDFADGGIGTIGGMDELFMWYIDGDVHNGLYDIETTAYIEVIGNKYENPELLKEQNK